MKRLVCLVFVGALVAMTLPAQAQCAADRTGNGIVDENDLAGVIVNYGCTGASCYGDTNDNGFTGGNDYLAILGNLGPCPVVEDVDGDGDVDGDDLTDVLLADGLNCKSDADKDGFVTLDDTFIIASSIGGDPDALSFAATDINGDGRLNNTDRNDALLDIGLDCRLDVDRDGTVEGGGTGADDFFLVCVALGLC